MASVWKNKAGQYSVQFTRNRQRDTVYIGRVSKQEADEFGACLTLLVKAVSRDRLPDARTQRWLAALAPNHQKSLETRGLIEAAAVASIDDLCKYCTVHADVADSTLQKYRDAHANLADHFGGATSIQRITPERVESFKRWLLKSGRRPKLGPLAESTASKRIEQARQFFKTAVDRGWLPANPFAGCVIHVGQFDDRSFYVTREATQKLMAKAPPDLQLMIALARYGGLRTPSEPYCLRWDWVDWKANTLTVFAPKNKRHEHKRWRKIPLFPEFRTLLLERSKTKTGELILPPDGKTNTALRNRVERLCVKCGIVAWAKIWHNMRSTRETELLDEGYPIHVVCAWLNNSPAVAIRHYAQVAKEHVRRAVAGCSELPLGTPGVGVFAADNLTALSLDQSGSVVSKPARASHSEPLIR